MAIAPQNEDAFLREVDDNLRHDRMVGFFTRWGTMVALGVGLFLIALALGLWWRSHRAAQAGLDSEALSIAIAPLATGGAPADPAALARLADSPRKGYRAVARFAQAGAAERKGDPAGAAGQYRALADDGSLPQPLRDLATLRAVAAQFDTLPPATVVDRLKGLAIAGTPFFPSAAELSAVAWLKQNRGDKAGPLFAAIARDPEAPASLRGRAAGMASALGQPVAPPSAATAPPAP